MARSGFDEIVDKVNNFTLFDGLRTPMNIGASENGVKGFPESTRRVLSGHSERCGVTGERD